MTFTLYESVNKATINQIASASWKLGDVVMQFGDNPNSITNAQNLGDGSGWVKEIVARSVKVKSLKLSPGMDIVDEGDCLRIVITRIDGGTF